jgi:hypothetical protein
MPLRPGNTKLGSLVHQWSIPSGLRHICVGASEICLMLCYAMQHHYRRDGVKDAMARNYKVSLRKDFVAIMLGWVRSLFARVVRVHASGEFYSEEYVRKWIEIVKRTPQVTYYAYTRSWADPEVYPALKELARLPNFIMWWSCDRATGAPPVVAGVRRAYLSIADDDTPRFKVDLVFRNNSKTVMKWLNGALVCPPENGVTKTTCSQCQLCFKRDAIPRNGKTDGKTRRRGNVLRVPLT